MQIKNIYLTLLFLLGLVPAIYAQCEGGTLSTVAGDTLVYTCPGDTLTDLVILASAGADTAASFTYVITNDAGIILAFSDSDTINLSDAPEGTCLLWGLSYTDTLRAAVGDTATTVVFSDSCADLSNAVTVVRAIPDGGTVATDGGDTEVTVCLSDTLSDVVSVVHTSGSAAQYTYVVTDTSNAILGLPGSADINFGNAGVGICRIWGLSFTGNITAQIGDNAGQVALTDDCASLSSNFITVIRDTICGTDTTEVEGCDGGTVSSASGDPIYTCPGDSTADVAVFSNTADPNANFTYVITDPNGMILAFSASDTIDFTNAGAGTCLVWGLSYTDTLRAAVGDNANSVSFSDSCADLSDNFVTVVRADPDGGIVSTIDGASEIEICLEDSISDVITFAVNGNSDANFAFVVTDTSNVILGLPSGNEVDFSTAGAGTCRVWGLSFTGAVTAVVGDTASAVSLTDGCFALSGNFVNVVRIDSCVEDTTTNPPTGGGSSNFTLVDADTDQDLHNIADGDSINVSSVQYVDHLNVRYDPDSSISDIGSVVFDFDGEQAFSIEQISPYALGGDNSGDYHPTGNSMTLGTHTITVSVYSSYQGMGDLLAQESVTFTLVESGGTTPVDTTGGGGNDTIVGSDMAVVSYTLVNAETNADIGPLNDGDEIDYTALGTSDISIRANTSPEEVGSVVFSFRGASSFRTENVYPYALGGDINGDYWTVEIPNGDYTLTATPYSESQAGGDEGDALTISFSVVSSPFARMQVQSDVRRILAFPNPVQNQLNLEMPEGRTGNVRIDIVTPMGNLIQRDDFTTSTDHWSRVIQTGDFLPGVYIIHVTNGMFRRTLRIVRE